MGKVVVSTWLKAGVTALFVALAFFSGYRYAAALYEADIAELIAEHAKNSKELTNDYRRKERESAKKLVEAWNALERARAESADLRVDVDRVRNQATALERKLSRANAASCASERKLLAGCTGLLARGADLVERCENVARDSASKHDAVVELHLSN